MKYSFLLFCLMLLFSSCDPGNWGDQPNPQSVALKNESNEVFSVYFYDQNIADPITGLKPLLREIVEINPDEFVIVPSLMIWRFNMAQEKKVSTVADIGTVKIADDVVAMIAAFAALDVEGVASLPGDVTREQISKGGMKKIAKSVHVDVTREGVKAELSIIVEYGFNIPTTSSRVQKRVKNAIEEMTGLAVIDVDIHIAGISIPD